MKDPIPVSIKPMAVQLGRIAPRDREVTFRATGRSPGREIKHSCQMPPLEYIGRHADIMTIAGGPITRGDQAKPALRNKQADLIAGGRKILNDPN
jgi:2,4-dienoyl-CoA reductase-like NADH-dependent reductase (Old Yellow Enzyme family)